MIYIAGSDIASKFPDDSFRIWSSSYNKYFNWSDMTSQEYRTYYTLGDKENVTYWRESKEYAEWAKRIEETIKDGGKVINKCDDTTLTSIQYGNESFCVAGPYTIGVDYGKVNVNDPDRKNPNYELDLTNYAGFVCNKEYGLLKKQQNDFIPVTDLAKGDQFYFIFSDNDANSIKLSYEYDLYGARIILLNFYGRRFRRTI